MRHHVPLLILGLIAATPAAAQLRAVPAQPASEAEALRGVEVFLINEGPTEIDADGPREIEVTATDGTKLVLERTPGPSPRVAPGGFAKARYVPVSVTRAAPVVASPAAAPATGETMVAGSTGPSSAFVDRFEPHEPIYGVFGGGNAGAKLQFSFAFRPFAEDAPIHLGALRFAYTQTMFWATDKPSAPFRATNYSPEIYVGVPLPDGFRVALGYRHDSNGGGPTDSVDANRVYLSATKSFDMGGDWRVDVSPQAWVFFGEQGNAPDLSDYWGYTGLTASIARKDGIKIAVTARGNFSTGRGSAELFASYPLVRAGGLGFYLFGQAYTGYGEALSDYRIRATHARAGIAVTR